MPRLTLYGATLCEDDGEAEGWTLQLSWGRFRLEFTFARRER